MSTETLLLWPWRPESVLTLNCTQITGDFNAGLFTWLNIELKHPDVWIRSILMCGSEASWCVDQKHPDVWIRSILMCGSEASWCVDQKHPDVWIVSNYHDYWSLELVSDWPCNHGNVEKLFDLWITLCSKPVFKGHSEKEDQGTLSQNHILSCQC